MKSVILALTLILSQIPAYAQSPLERQRIALVIGNSAYHNSPLTNPVNDARAMEQALKDVGFTVIRVENADTNEMYQAVKEFGLRLNENTVALFYFSGHGTQYEGENYLLSTDDDKLINEDQLEYAAVKANYILSVMEGSRSDMNIFLLDACRNPPKFAAKTKSLDWKKGLVGMGSSGDTFISYATAPGKVAYDGDGKNSPYTASLIKRIREPKPIVIMIQDVTNDVVQSTGAKQRPWYNASLTKNFYFTLPPAPQITTPQPQIAAQVPPPAQQTTIPPAENPAWLAGLLAWADEFKLTPQQLPRESKALQQLTHLNLGHENSEQPKITRLPAEIGQLRALKQIDLYDNGLTTLPKEIGQLQQLQQLDLGGNRLTSLPAEIGALQQLQKLKLDDNQLQKLPVEIIRLNNLQELNLSINPRLQTSNEQEIFIQKIKSIKR